VVATVEVPSSKSLTNRYLLLAALADGPSTVRRPLVSRDAELMVGALRALGVTVERDEDDREWRVTPPTRLRGDVDVDCGLAGTVMRFVPPVAALSDGPVRFDGDPEARVRPVGPLLEGLAQLGVTVRGGEGGTLPFTVEGRGRVPGGTVRLDASASSQFVSALLLAGSRFDRGLRLEVTGPVPSRPHLDMTVQVLRDVGVRVRAEAAVWEVAPGPVHPLDVVVEPDLSSAAPFLAAAAVTGGRVTVAGWPSRTTQAGDALPGILERMGARAHLGQDGMTLRGPERGTLRGVDLDLHDVGELTPVVAAVAAAAATPSTLRGIAHLRGHETDRLAALERELSGAGARVEQTADGLHIEPGPLRATTWHTYGDHRMAMAGAVVALLAPGTMVLDPATAGKTFPGFVDAWESAVRR
jgi:3-phosphoshikimate 1-carboxyvinyltransferase